MFKENKNKVETIIKTGEEPQATRLNGTQRLRECGLILVVLLSILLFIALLTYSPADPSWSQTAWGVDIENAGGIVGAWIADTLFFTFGSLAYPLPVLLTVMTWAALRQCGNGEPIDLMLWGTRLAGFVVLLLTSCGLADLNFDDIGYFSSGGVIGDVLTSLALPTLNTLGTTLVLLFLWGAGVTLLTGVSWLRIVEWIGKYCIQFCSGFLNRLRGDREEVLEPQLAMSAMPTMTASTPRQEPSFVEPSIDDAISELESHSNSLDETESSASDESPRRYNIHMPETSVAWEEDDEDEYDPLFAPSRPIAPAAVKAKPVQPVNQHQPMASPQPASQPQSVVQPQPAVAAQQTAPVQQVTPSVEPTAPVQAASMAPNREAHNQGSAAQAGSVVASAPIAQQSERAPIERTHQLEATIESLEQAAWDDDDMGLDTSSEVETTVVPTQPESPRSTSSYVEEEVHSVWRGEEHQPVNTPFSVQHDVSTSHIEPVIQEEPSEPVISNFDVVDDDGMDFVSHEYDDAEEMASPSVVEPSVPTHSVSASAPLQGQPIAQEQSQDLNPQSPQDKDSQAFQSMVADAQAKVVAQQNPFLVQHEPNLPKPAEPLPTLDLLYHPEKRDNFIDRDALEDIARLVESKLADYKIKARVVDIFPGPVITRFELDLAPGVKVSRISGLSMDLARSLSAMAVRVVEVIPGKPYVGLELPNMSRQTVYLSDVISSPQFMEAKSPTTVVLGQDIAGEAVVADLSKMPHVLVAGTTGSGKSVGVNVMILSMLYKSSPEDVRFIMIDPKMLELSVYEGIPHLLSEVVTDMKDASNALRWCVGEMERRYKLMSLLGVRNIKGFNDKLKMAADAGHPIHDPLWQPGDSMDPEPPLLEKLPYIVVIVDEFADLMMVVGKKVEELIARLAQKARAAGIHLILATQRPSVDVITGLIKANIPTRVAFTVSTKTDSRTILDQSGAESLLGMGDMLYLPPGSSHTVRVHGAFASDDDVHAVVNNWKARGRPNYIDAITHGDQGPESLLPGEKMESDEEVDPLFDQVVEHVVETRRGSVSGVQRRFKIGFNRAARIVDQLEAQGVVSAPGHNGNREVLAPKPGRDMN